jgi:hypothetical protein
MSDVHVMDVLAPLLAAVVFVAVMSCVREPARLRLNAVLVAGSTLAYLSGGFGVAELIYPAVTTPVAYAATRSYRFVALGWFMHAVWDVLHHLYGNPIWPFMPTSSLGCLLFDTAIACWFLTLPAAPAAAASGSVRRAGWRSAEA